MHVRCNKSLSLEAEEKSSITRRKPHEVHKECVCVFVFIEQESIVLHFRRGKKRGTCLIWGWVNDPKEVIPRLDPVCAMDGISRRRGMRVPLNFPLKGLCHRGRQQWRMRVRGKVRNRWTGKLRKRD